MLGLSVCPDCLNRCNICALRRPPCEKARPKLQMDLDSALLTICICLKARFVGHTTQNATQNARATKRQTTQNARANSAQTGLNQPLFSPVSNLPSSRKSCLLTKTCTPISRLFLLQCWAKSVGLKCPHFPFKDPLSSLRSVPNNKTPNYRSNYIPK